MADQINTDINLELKDEDILSKVQRLAGFMQLIATASKEVRENLVIDPKTLAFISAASKGDLNTITQRAAGAAAKADLRGQPAAVGADVLKTQLSVNQQIAKVGEQLNNELTLQTKLQKGIIDLDTLSYKQKLANFEIGKLLAIQPQAQGKTLEQVNAELARQQNILRIINLEMEDINAAAVAQAARQKEIAEAEKRSQAIIAAAQAQRAQQVEAAHRKQAEQNIGFAAIEAQQIKQQIDEAEGERRAQILQTQRVQKQTLEDQRATARRVREEEAAAAKKAKEEAAATTPQALSRAGAQQFEQADALRKIKANIVDLDTIAYQRQAAQVEIGTLLRQKAAGTAQAQAEVNVQLEKQYAILRQLDIAQKDFQAHSRINNILQTGGADLLKIQAQLIVNYGIINAIIGSIRFSTQFITDLDESFHQLQAIAGLTNTEMVGLRSTILGIAQDSKFSAKEIADSAVVLAQAGLSGDQIKGSLKAINDLATASGSTLANAVQNVTSVLNVFNYGADQTAQIANQMTGALNLSKLSMDQITLGIQYAANTAADAKVPFAEMIATFGALANAGIRSGSTIGTGYRKLLQDLLNPTEKFQNRVAQLGLSMEQLDIKTRGVGVVLSTLQKAGFTASDAMATLDVRAAAVLVPLLRSADAIGIFQQKLYLTDSVVSGTEKQMESLNNSLNKLKNSFGSIVFDTFQKLVGVIAKVSTGIADLLNNLGGLRPVLEIVIAGFVTLASGALFGQLLKLFEGLTGIGAAFKSAFSGFGILINLFKTFEFSVSGAIASLQLFRGALLLSGGPVFLALAVAVTGAYYAYKALSGAIDDNSTRLEKAKTDLSKLEAETEKFGQRSTQLNNFMKTLVDQYDELSQNSELLRARTLEAAAAFNKMGSETILAGDRIDVLIEKVKKLSAENYQAAANAASAQLAQLDLTNKLTEKDLETKRQAGLNTVNKLSNRLETNAAFESNKTVDPAVTAAVELAKATFANSNRTKDDVDRLVTQIAKAQTDIADKDVPKSVKDTLDTLKDLAAEQKQGLDEIYKNRLTGGELQNKISSTTLDAKEIASVIKILGEESPAAQEAVKQFRDSPSPSAGKIAETNLNTVISQLDKKIDELKTNPESAASDSLTILQGKRAEVEKARLEISGQNLAREKKRVEDSNEIAELDAKQAEIIVQTGNMRAAELATQTIISSAQVKRKNAIDEATAYTKSEKFIKDRFSEYGLTATDSAIKAEAQNYINVKKRAADIEFQNAADTAKKNLANRSFNTDPALARSIISPIQELKNAIMATTTAYKKQIDMIETSVRQAKAQREAMDNPRNARFIGDGARFLKDQENDLINEKALRDKAAASQAYLIKLKEDQVKAEALAKKSMAQAEAEALAGQDFGGIPQGKQNTKGFKIDKTETNQATKELLALGEEQRRVEKAIADTNAELERYNNLLTENESLSKTLSDSFDQFKVESYYGAQAMSQDFKNVFGDLRTGFQDTVRNFINGNATIAQSFKALSIKIIQSLQDIAIKKATQGIFDSILGALPGGLGSIFGGSSGGTSFTGGSFGNAANTATISGGNMQVTGMTGFARGGLVTGGTPGRDSVPVITMPDEYILNAQATRAIGVGTLNKINNGNLNLSQALSGSVAVGGGDGDKTVNVWVISPDQQPPLGPNDVVAIVDDNIRRSGSLKTLIKQVQM